MKKPFPKFDTEKEFIEWFQKTDLGEEYMDPDDLMTAEQFFNEYVKDKMISLRLSSPLLHTIKQAAEKQGIKYQKLIRLILTKNINKYL